MNQNRREGGWTYVELIVALLILSVLTASVYPLITTFHTSDVERERQLQALWVGQMAIERQMAITSTNRQTEGRETFRLDRHVYDVVWKRRSVRDGLDAVEVKVAWKVQDQSRELRLERYVTLQ